MVGLAAAYLPAIAWPHYLSLDAHAAAAMTGSRGSGRGRPAACEP